MKANEDGAFKYQLFQDKNEGDELVMVEQYVDLLPVTMDSHQNAHTPMIV